MISCDLPVNAARFVESSTLVCGGNMGLTALLFPK